jgi:hypothetical protein
LLAYFSAISLLRRTRLVSFDDVVDNDDADDDDAGLGGAGPNDAITLRARIYY